MPTHEPRDPSRERERPDRHVPVMLDRCVELLAPALDADGAVVVDATLGLGGHSEALLTSCPRAVLVGIDRDPQALELARRRLAGFGERVRLVHAVYDELPQVLSDLGSTPSAACSWTWGSRRCSSTRRRAASRTPSTRRSTCG
jgi:16S rRNA C1402 N4-methylase RsmH